MRRRAFLGALIPTPGGMRRRGVEYLWRRQGGDGGWHSETYGLLRSGQSLTGLIVNALLDAGVPAGDARVVRAVRFLEGQVSAEGAVGLSGDDYPCYATALALRAFVRTGRVGTERLVGWLRGQQMGLLNGFAEQHAAYGAWGIGGARRTAPDPGHVDISMTRHVLEALAEAGVPATDGMMRQARVFVRRCQNADGGFYFSTIETGANKAGETEGGYASYGTTTADGLICLAAMGDRDWGPALGWLRRHDDASLPAGFTSAARRRYAEGLRYYYADAAARAFRVAGVRRSVGYVEGLRRLQRADGSWRNPEVLVKEDDPLIATALAVSGLG